MHWYNLPAVLMALSVSSSTTLSISGLLENNLSIGQATKRLTAHLLVIVGIALLVLGDFRLTNVSVIMLLLCVALSKLTHVLYVRLEKNERQTRLTEWPNRAWSAWLARFDLSTLVLLCALPSALFWCHFREQQFSSPQVKTYSYWTSDIATLVLNIVSSSFALNSAGPIFAWDLNTKENADTERSVADVGGRNIMSKALVWLVFAGSMYGPLTTPVLSSWQWLGFCLESTAYLLLQDWRKVPAAPSDNRLHRMVGPFRTKAAQLDEERLDYEPLVEDSNVGDERSHGNSLLRLAILVGIPAAMCGLVYHSLVLPSPPQQSPRSTLDFQYHGKAALDIVVARYDETASDVAAHIQLLMGVPTIKGLQPTIQIYDKGEASSAFEQELEDILSLGPQQPDVIANTLPNVGRETDTYLHHIKTNWDTLANYTMFMQADAHYWASEYTRRIQDYFVPQTGFLSLGKVGGFCSSCDRCHDRDWTEEAYMLKDLYGDFNNANECKDILLTYRGQFIASAARLRGNEKETYEKWLNMLRDEQSIVHTAPYTESDTSRKEDEMSAPQIGFTLERSWGMMLQCSEKRIAERCPSLLSGLVGPGVLGEGVRVGDCQCLDDLP
ncbi:uncharacterized protein LTR77_006269 [Saxophila tyrrhenica]|uniref:Glycosyltransferase 2-like domain-containing protein n=1 Tax=Saxophila tyrrhenica TaxID=1690608 RepID=A0AAV9P834_9PEZI|nr:hypothetical protein LTR77_006269 [Saxophila tyrrhenica]